jgi:hypothetical protein
MPGTPENTAAPSSSPGDFGLPSTPGPTAQGDGARHQGLEQANTLMNQAAAFYADAGSGPRSYAGANPFAAATMDMATATNDIAKHLMRPERPRTENPGLTATEAHKQAMRYVATETLRRSVAMRGPGNTAGNAPAGSGLGPPAQTTPQSIAAQLADISRSQTVIASAASGISGNAPTRTAGPSGRNSPGTPPRAPANSPGHGLG